MIHCLFSSDILKHKIFLMMQMIKSHSELMPVRRIFFIMYLNLFHSKRKKSLQNSVNAFCIKLNSIREKFTNPHSILTLLKKKVGNDFKHTLYIHCLIFYRDLVKTRDFNYTLSLTPLFQQY